MRCSRGSFGRDWELPAILRGTERAGQRAVSPLGLGDSEMQSEQGRGLFLPWGFLTPKCFSWLEESLCKNVTSHSGSAHPLLAVTRP